MQSSGSSGGCKLSSNQPTSLQAPRCMSPVHKLRAQASSLSQQAQGSGSQGTSVQPDPGHKQQAHRNF